MSKIQKLIERLDEVLSTCREILVENRYSKNAMPENVRRRT